MRGLTRPGIVVESTSKFLRGLRHRHPGLLGPVDPETARKHVDRGGDGCFAPIRPSESKRRLPEAAADLLVLATRFHDTEASGLESYRILARALAEQCEVVADAGAGPRVRVKEPDEMPRAVVLNPADPDATDTEHRGVGYLVQVMETYRPESPPEPGEPAGTEASTPARPDLIAHVAVGPMDVHAGAAPEPALADTEARGIKPREWLGDSHYGSEENLKGAATHGVEVVAPVMPAKGSKQGELTLEDLDLDGRGHVTRCPVGQAPRSTSEGDERIQAVFDEAACAAFPLRAACPAAAVGRKGRRFKYTRPSPPSRTAVGEPDGDLPGALSLARGDRGDDSEAVEPR